MTEGAPREISDKQIRDIVENTKDTSRQESHQKPNGNSFKNRIAAGMAAFAIATGVGAAASGCEYIPTERIETTVESNETEPSVKVTPTETSVKVDPVGTTETTETTPAPTETTVETTAPTETDVNVELAEAPEISGLSKEIEDGKVVYKAVEGNEYGIEAGEFAGEYNPNVFVDGEKIGCVNLIPIAAEKILNDQLADIPENELKFKILLPVEVVEGDQNGNNEINIILEDDFYGNKGIIINSEDNMNVYNICPNSDWFLRYPFDYEGSKLVTIINSSSKLTTYENPNKMLNETAMYFLQTNVSANENFNSQDLFQSSFGEILTQSNGEEVSLGLADENGTYNVLIEDIVKTDDGVLIGITSEK